MRFLIRWQLALLLVAAGGLGLLFGLSDYAGLARRVFAPSVGPYFGARRDLLVVALTPARYQALRLGLLALAGGAATLLGLTGRRPGPATRRPAGWARAARRWWAALASPWQALSGAEQGLAAGLLAAVAGARLYYAACYPLSLDELASYDFYVLPGAAVTASYYPFPNNHLLANLLVGLLPGASPTLALRLLPTLAGLLTLPLVYALALRAGRFAVATLGLGLYWLSPLGVYYAVAGRGYAWALLATLAGLFAALELLRPTAGRVTRQLAWAVFGGSGLLGLYAVPTHLYALLGLGLGLLVGFARQPARRRGLWLAQLAVATLGIGAGALVLYLPVGVVSGWPALLANPYVARHAGPEFWAGIGPWLVGTATELLGQRGLSAAAFCGVLGLAPVALWWGRLPGPARRLGWLLLAQLGLWLGVVAGQRAYPPARTLLPVLLAFFLLLALVGQALWGRWQLGRPRAGAPLGPASRAATVGLLALVLALYGGYRLRREQAVIQQHTRWQRDMRQAYTWLRDQPLRRIWVLARAQALVWQHEALAAGAPPLPLVVVDDVPPRPPGAVGEVQVLPAGVGPGGAPRPVRYANAAVVIVPVSPAQPLVRE